MCQISGSKKIEQIWYRSNLISLSLTRCYSFNLFLVMKRIHQLYRWNTILLIQVSKLTSDWLKSIVQTMVKSRGSKNFHGKEKMVVMKNTVRSASIWRRWCWNETMTFYGWWLGMMKVIANRFKSAENFYALFNITFRKIRHAKQLYTIMHR